jgi:YHS domain-containing protein
MVGRIPTVATNIRVAASMLVCLAATLAGCASSSSASRDGRRTSECPVCRCNNDLGCLIVRIDQTTPRSDWQGTTYYFCSQDCKAAFDRAPGQYVKK